LIDWLHQNNRAIWLDAEAAGDKDREDGLAAYFLVNQGTDYIGQAPGGEPDNWWPGYDVSLGAALGPRQTTGGIFRRDFERGVVLVNQPGTSQVTVSLGASYTD